MRGWKWLLAAALMLSAVVLLALWLRSALFAMPSLPSFVLEIGAEDPLRSATDSVQVRSSDTLTITLRPTAPVMGPVELKPLTGHASGPLAAWPVTPVVGEQGSYRLRAPAGEILQPGRRRIVFVVSRPWARERAPSDLPVCGALAAEACLVEGVVEIVPP